MSDIIISRQIRSIHCSVWKMYVWSCNFLVVGHRNIVRIIKFSAKLNENRPVRTISKFPSKTFLWFLIHILATHCIFSRLSWYHFVFFFEKFYRTHLWWEKSFWELSVFRKNLPNIIKWIAYWRWQFFIWISNNMIKFIWLFFRYGMS